MVFISKNLIRKCKYCEKPPKESFGKIQKNGKKRKKGYFTTCGSKECLNKQYNDQYVCRKKGMLNKESYGRCKICDKEFKRLSISHKYYCIKCVPDKSWRARARRYGIGKPQFEELLKKQKGKCILCDRIPEVIDHCHKTRKVRGLLCNKCNGNIRLLDMNEEFIKKAVEYVGRNYGTI